MHCAVGEPQQAAALQRRACKDRALDGAACPWQRPRPRSQPARWCAAGDGAGARAIAAVLQPHAARSLEPGACRRPARKVRGRGAWACMRGITPAASQPLSANHTGRMSITTTCHTPREAAPHAATPWTWTVAHSDTQACGHALRRTAAPMAQQQSLASCSCQQRGTHAWEADTHHRGDDASAAAARRPRSHRVHTHTRHRTHAIMDDP
jgi:hypothetical protein